MELLFAFFNIGFGLIFTLIGFKIYNPFKGKNQSEKEQEWYKKYSFLFKIGGVGLLFWGIANVIVNI